MNGDSLVFLFIDVCCSEHMAEVEIFSLLEEQIPKYKIRADSMTQFGGYENQDWFCPFPALAVPADGLGLSKDMCRETLNYFREYLLFDGPISIAIDDNNEEKKNKNG